MTMKFPPELHPIVKNAALVALVPRYGGRVGLALRVSRALDRWEAGRTAQPCELEQRGKPYGLEAESTSCQCQGCFERDLYKYFGAAYRKLYHTAP